MLMKDLFTEGDAINTLATTLYNKLLIQDYEHNDVVRGTVFLCSEKINDDSNDEADDDDDIIDFTFKDITYIMRCLQQQL